MSDKYDQEPESRSLYYVMPAEIMDMDISNSHKLMYILLSGLAHKDGECYPSDKYLGERLKMSADRAGKVVNELANYGLISKKTIPHPQQPFHKIRIIKMCVEFKKCLRTGKNNDIENRKNNCSETVKNAEEVSEGNSNIKRSTNVDPKKQKKKYIDHVLLTDEELQKLENEFGPSRTRLMIKKLDAYIGSKGRKYKSHYKTIISWIHKEEGEKINPNKPTGKGMR